jgi:hypothetical protein
MEFFDRIVLLDGGTVALSVTLIGSLASKSGHKFSALTSLICSWAAFMLSMMFGLARNWIEHDRLAKAEMNSFLIALQQSFKAEANFGKAIYGESPEVHDLQKAIDQGGAVFKAGQNKHQSLLLRTKLAGIASLVCTLLAFGLLLVFAIKNLLSM